MASFNSIQIQALVREMDHSMRRHKGLKTTNPPEFRNKVSADNQVLYNQFPTIFEMHIEGKLDQTFFEMLKMRRKIELGEITEDEASKIVGQKLFDRFVDPVVKKLDGPTGAAAPATAPAPVGSYADYYKQFETNERTE
jgi:hypothetical protein